MKDGIFVALSTFAEYDPSPLRALERSGVPFSLNTAGRRLTAGEVVAMGKGAVAIIAGVEPYDAGVLAGLPGLRCISRCGVGTDAIDLAAARARGIAVLNTPDVVVGPVAELTLAMIFDLLRRVTVHTVLLRQRTWRKVAGNSIAGKRVGVIGLGRIGRTVAGMLRRLDVDVLGHDSAPDHVWARQAGVAVAGLDNLLSESDIVTVHVASPAVGQGEGFVLGAREIDMMKEGAFLVNTSRGKFVDENALCVALKSGHLAGAALDVYAEEPYRGPLCDLDNVLLTPHIATLTVESRAVMEGEAVRNALTFLGVGGPNKEGER